MHGLTIQTFTLSRFTSPRNQTPPRASSHKLMHPLIRAIISRAIPPQKTKTCGVVCVPGHNQQWQKPTTHREAANNRPTTSAPTLTRIAAADAALVSSDWKKYIAASREKSYQFARTLVYRKRRAHFATPTTARVTYERAVKAAPACKQGRFAGPPLMRRALRAAIEQVPGRPEGHNADTQTMLELLRLRADTRPTWCSKALDLTCHRTVVRQPTRRNSAGRLCQRRPTMQLPTHKRLQSAGQ